MPIAKLAELIGVPRWRLDDTEKDRGRTLSLEQTIKACEILRALPYGLLLARARHAGSLEIPLVDNRAGLVWATHLACSGLRA